MRSLRRRGSAYIYNSNRFLKRRDTYTLLDLTEDGAEGEVI